MTPALKPISGGLGLGLMLAVSMTTLATAQTPISGHVTPSGAFDQEHLGPGGLHKCRAYKQVRHHSDEMQAKDHGQLTPGDTRRLIAELSRARHMPPAKLTPADCGVPL